MDIRARMDVQVKAGDGPHRVRQSAASLAPRTGDLKRIRALRGSETGFDRVVWRRICALGWLELGTGGTGSAMAAVCALAEELGAALVPEPVIPALMAVRLLSGAPPPDDRLPEMLAGERIVLPAWQETAGSIDPLGETELRDGRLYGRKIMVPMAAGADAFLVTGRHGVALVARDAAGLTLETRRTEDGGHLGTLTLDGTPAIPLDGDPALALDGAIMAHAAYLLGITDRALTITRQHLKTREVQHRKQGLFRMLQQRVADMDIQVSLTRTVVNSASYAVDNATAARSRGGAVSRAKLRATDAAMVVSRTCIQVYGGLGHLDVNDISLFARKVAVLAPLYGSPAAHRSRLRPAAAPETVS
jgi:alkylation response protein AidB-like acyl-CoA dehydrogenase